MAEASQAGMLAARGKQGCHQTPQIIKVTLEHCSARVRAPVSVVAGAYPDPSSALLPVLPKDFFEVHSGGAE